jgi:hypothetical protein
MHRCPGCKTSFLPAAYIYHLKLTQHPLCCEARELLDRMDSPDSEEDEDEDEEQEDLFYDEEGHRELLFPAQTGMELDVPDESGLGLDLGLEDDQQEEPHVRRAQEVRWAAEEEFRKTPVVGGFPSTEAGAPIANVRADAKADPRYESYHTCLKDRSDRNNLCAPFSSQLDWEVAQWAKLCGPSSTAFTELLKIDGVSA